MGRDLYDWPGIEPPHWEEPPRSNPARRILLALVSLALVCILIFGLSGGLVDFVRLRLQRGALEDVLDDYMTAMAAADARSAYALFSDSGRRGTSLSDLNALIRNNYVLFDSYATVNVESFDRRSEFATGTVEYSTGFRGTFRVWFESAGGTWKIRRINITVPPQKIREFSAERA